MSRDEKNHFCVIHTKTAVFISRGEYDECKERYDEMEKDVMFVEILEEK